MFQFLFNGRPVAIVLRGPKIEICPFGLPVLMLLLRNLAINLLLLLVSTAFALLVVELGYRYLNEISIRAPETRLSEDGTGRVSTFKPSLNPQLMYEPIPGAISKYTGQINIINAFGMRDKEYTLAKPPGTFRIAVLGDSIAYGFGLPVEQSFAKQLEVVLAADKNIRMPVEVLNFGVPGFDTKQEIAWYKQNAQRFAPDLVIIAYCLNDTHEASWEAQVFKGSHIPVWRHLFVWSVISDRLDIMFERWRYGDGQYAANHSRDPVFASMQAISVDIASQQPVLIMVYPYLQDFDNYGYHDIHSRIKAAAKKYKLAEIDLLSKYVRFDPLDLRVPQYREHDQIHPGEQANLIAAQEVRAWLRENFFGAQ